MITSSAKNGFDLLLQRALQTAFGRTSQGQCEVEHRIVEHVPAAERALMLTITSYTFRLILLIHYALDDATRSHFSTSLDGAALTDDGLRDLIAEHGNLCCGAFNRELAGFLPDTGMSTPNELDPRSAQHLAELQPSHTSHVRLRAGDSLVLHASLFVFSHAEMDFFVTHAEAEQSTGELEML